ncbi:hypothetical protein ACOMHN_006783 [Nucella lapillus]
MVSHPCGQFIFHNPIRSFNGTLCLGMSRATIDQNHLRPHLGKLLNDVGCEFSTIVALEYSWSAKIQEKKQELSCDVHGTLGLERAQQMKLAQVLLVMQNERK